MKKALLLVNPRSGKQTIRLHLLDVMDILSRKYDLSVHITRSSEDIIETAAGTDFQTVIVCGGDGTLSNTVNGILQNPRSSEICLGYIPCGTANDVAATLGIPRKFSAAAAYVCRNLPHSHDAGKFMDKSFIYTASFGMFTQTSYRTSQNMKNALGNFAYLLNGASELLSLKDYDIHIEYDGGELDVRSAVFCGISNTIYMGGGLICLPSDYALLDDGNLELLVIKKPRNIFELENLVRYLVEKQYNNEYMTLLQSGSFRVHCQQPINWTLDGEAGGEHSDVTVSCLSHAVNLIKR